mgnify:CR=1 FL=1
MKTYICSECRREIPPDSDFCYHCGSLKSKAFVIDYGSPQSPDGQQPCPECGKPNDQGAKFCRHCGIEMDTVTARPENYSSRNNYSQESCSQGSCYQGYPYGYPSTPVLVKNGGIAMMASILFGFFGIYGVGHLILKRWSRGFMFLTMSAVNWYIYLSVGSFPALILMISLLIFFKQSMEITNIAYGRS